MIRIGKLAIIGIILTFISMGFIQTSALAKDNNEGFIYGKVLTRTGNTYVGILRWGDEEAFWDDLFNSIKEDLPYMENFRSDKKEEIDVLIREEKDLYRKEKALRKEESKLRKKEAEIQKKMQKIESSNKKSKDYDRQMEVIEMELDENEIALENLIEEIEIIHEQMEEPESPQYYSRNEDSFLDILGGSIKINFDGFGGSRQFIARFGDMKKIEVIGSEDAEITMKNGSVYVVSGYSNDVGNDILIKDESLGDIEVSWRKIESIEFLPTPKNVEPGGYRAYGTVMSDAGEFKGYIQWDSQECLSYDKIDGDSEDGRMSIDLGKIVKIERRNRSSSYVEIVDGRRMLLDGTNDVDGSIRGIMVEDERYGRVKVSWDAFEYATFEKNGKSGKAYDDYKTPRKLSGTVITEDGKTYKGRIVFDMDESESWEMLNGDRFDIEYNIPFSLIKSISPRSRNASQIEFIKGEKIRLDGSQDVSANNDGILIFADENSDPVHVDWEDLEKIEFNW